MKKTCLVIDDDPVNREILQAYMEEKGFSVSAVNNGSDALLLCDIKNFDCIFVDWEMPVTDGIEFIKTYTKNKQKLPKLIMCSIKDKDHEISYAYEAGANEYFIKPIKRKDLDEKLKKIGVI